MRLLYFSKNYSTHDHRFLLASIHGGHETFYLRLEGNTRQMEDRPVPPQVEQIQWVGGRQPFHWYNLPAYTLDFRRVIQVVKPDLVHAGPIQTCALIVALAGFHPLLSMSWGFDLMQDVHRNRWMKAGTKFVMKRSAYFTSDAAVTREVAIAFGMDPAHTSIVPWGVDLDIFKPVNGHTQVKSNRQILCNRSWEPRYGVDILAQAFGQIAAVRKDLGLILLGGGSQAQSIRTILNTAGVLDRVQFGGQVSQKELPGWYREADLFVSPSHVDGTSVSLLEALASGLPVIVSDIPGNKEWVEDGINGWLFPDGNSSALADKIATVLDQPERLVEVGRAGRRSVQERGDWVKNEALLLKSYELAIQHVRN